MVPEEVSIQKTDPSTNPSSLQKLPSLLSSQALFSSATYSRNYESVIYLIVLYCLHLLSYCIPLLRQCRVLQNMLKDSIFFLTGSLSGQSKDGKK